MTYFQFFNYPIYVGARLDDFNSSLKKLLTKIGLKELGDSVPDLTESNARLLRLERASGRVARQIMAFRPDNRFGEEGIVQLAGHRVYRYRNVAMMVFSFASPVWEMGVFPHFGSDKEGERGANMAIARFLGLALSFHGVLGLWGVPVEEGLVVMRPKESEGEAVFIDLYNHRLLSVEGEKKLPPCFDILRLDRRLHGRQIPMKQDQLSSFLLQYTCFLSTQGASLAVRQMVQNVSRVAEGIIYPFDHFVPRARDNAA